MKRDRNKKISEKAIAAAAALGAAAVVTASIVAYNKTVSTLTPTGSGTAESSTWVFSAPSVSSTPAVTPNEEARPANATAANSGEDRRVPYELPDEPDEPAGVITDEAREVNKPVVSHARNILPVKGEVTHPFSNGELVKSETLGVWKTHDGCDIDCPLGSEVKSMSAGVVTEIREDPLWGVCVTVEQENGLEAHYCGLAKELSVKTGGELKEGDIIGKTADTCQAEIVQPPHLHLGVKENGKWIDPMSVIETEQ